MTKEISKLEPQEIYKNMMYWLWQFKDIPGSNNKDIIRAKIIADGAYVEFEHIADTMNSVEFVDELNSMRDRFVEFVMDAVKSAETDEQAYTNLFNMFEDCGVTLGIKLKDE